MNYIQEINAFYEDVEAAGLSSKEINLFNALLRINNKAQWIKVFTVRPSYLQKLTGQAKSTNERARKELVEKGFIKFKKGSGSRMSRYQIIPAAERERPEPVFTEEVDEEPVQDIEEEIDEETEPENDPLQEVNQTEKFNAFTTFNKAFERTPSPLQIEDINNFLDHDGMPEELIIFAFEQAGLGGKPYNFARKMLSEWAKLGLKTKEEARQEMQKHRQQYTRSSRASPAPSRYTGAF